MEHYAAGQLRAQERRERAAEAGRSDWLENLTHFLRHELRNSVIGVQMSPDLLERRAGPDERTGVYFERARQGLKVIQRLLESASHATSLESSFMQDPIAPTSPARRVVGVRCAHPNAIRQRRGWRSAQTP
jgi:signal transduction histidine kinase